MFHRQKFPLLFLLSFSLYGCAGGHFSTQRTMGEKPSLVNGGLAQEELKRDPTPSRLDHAPAGIARTSVGSVKEKHVSPVSDSPLPPLPIPSRQASNSWENLPQKEKARAKKHNLTSTYLQETSFSTLPGYAQEPIENNVRLFLESCKIFSKRPSSQPIGYFGIGGTISNWQTPCIEGGKLNKKGASRKDWQAFFETYFSPFRVVNKKNEPTDVLITGYYIPTLEGSRYKSARFKYPIYRRPKDLVSIAPNTVQSENLQRRFAGRLTKDKHIIPYYTREEIENGALKNKHLEIAWVDNAVDLFFLHIQGSGFIKLQDGSTILVSYVAKNGYSYTSIGKILSKKLDKKPTAINGNWIKTWLNAHPQEARKLMWKNKSYIFFKEKSHKQKILGALGSPLQKEKSIATDFVSLPLGLPVWLDVADPLDPKKRMHHLLHIQDTGSALIGPNHIDLFMGVDKIAEKKAFAMKNDHGRLFVLLPKTSLSYCHVCTFLPKPETPKIQKK